MSTAWFFMSKYGSQDFTQKLTLTIFKLSWENLRILERDMCDSNWFYNRHVKISQVLRSNSYKRFPLKKRSSHHLFSKGSYEHENPTRVAFRCSSTLWRSWIAVGKLARHSGGESKYLFPKRYLTTGTRFASSHVLHGNCPNASKGDWASSTTGIPSLPVTSPG